MARHMKLAAKGLTLLLATQAAATPLAEPMAVYKELLKRDPPAALPGSATDAELKWQPVLDLYSFPALVNVADY